MDDLAGLLTLAALLVTTVLLIKLCEHLETRG